jgi:hypothetical protein
LLDSSSELNSIARQFERWPVRLQQTARSNHPANQQQEYQGKAEKDASN